MSASTMDTPAQRLARKQERDRRRSEINQSFQFVVEEAQDNENKLYDAVFVDNGMLETEEEIEEVRKFAQYQIDLENRRNGGLLTRLSQSFSFRNQDAPTVPFEVQSSSAASSFPTMNIRGGLYNAHLDEEGQGKNNFRSINANDGPSWGSRLGSAKVQEKLFDTFFAVRGKGMFLLFFVMLVVLLVGIIVSVKDISSDNPNNENEVEKTIRSLLTEQGVSSKHFSKHSSPQYRSLAFITKEVVSEHIKFDSLNEKSVFTYEDGVLTSFNQAYADRHKILERYVLLVLYYSTTTNSKDWKANGKWLESGTDVCSNWHGVTCDSITSIKNSLELNYVTELSLNDNALVGTIPDELSHLDDLTSLDLDGNYLSGTLPNSIGKLTSLNTLKISDNFLDGDVPAGVCDLVNAGILSEFYSSCGGGKGQINCDCCDVCI